MPDTGINLTIGPKGISMEVVSLPEDENKSWYASDNLDTDVCRCEHVRGWHYNGVGSCLECTCAEFVAASDVVVADLGEAGT